MQSPERLLRRTLRSFAPYRRGTTVDEVRRRYGIEHPVKLSQNENPLGSSPRALAALHGISALSDYFEDDHLTLKSRLAERYGLTNEHVVLGHGSNELVQLAFTAFVDPGDEIVMALPTFSLFKKDATIFGARAIEVPLRDGVHDLEAMGRAAGERTKLVFVCDPNNPTGTRVEPAALAAFAGALPPGVLLVIDQAYREFMDAGGSEGVDILKTRPETLVLRTSSKIYGLAAARFGYGYSSPQVVAWMDSVRLPFNVARPATVAVLAAFDDDDFIARSIANNETGKAYFARELDRLGVHYYPTAANFVALAVPIGADAAYEALLERGIIVRSGDGLGLPGYLRVSIGTPDENAAFIAAFEALLAKWRA
ncbi:MAG: histidinol-phosphate transaminase [Candidatus Eremiobacteraeota bacterium]|nr:histidinol-phosphate transaminase [Candidatus Eremiobacteraeota bacterium]